ncbi:MAG: hypothetical protein LBN08_07155 [Lactobacillales bacterium]|jgi:hypothetical protein|nr:hypothetical protein [Lactobacillales bacterium]
MLAIKRVITAILIFIGIVFATELYVFHLDSFKDAACSAGFIFDKAARTNTNQEMVDDFIAASEKTGAKIYYIAEKYPADNLKGIDIYGTGAALKDLKQSFILPGEYNSYIVGNVKVEFKKFSEIPDIKKLETLYFTNYRNDKVISQCCEELSDKYLSGIPRIRGFDNYNKYLIFTTVIILLLVFFLNIYELIFRMKEVTVLSILGVSYNATRFKNLFIDSLLMIFEYIIFKKVIDSNQQSIIPLSGFVIFLVMMILIYTLIGKMNIRKNLSRAMDFSRFINMNYICKTVVSILALLLLSTNIILIKQAIDYGAQKSYFDTHKNYSYARIDDVENALDVQEIYQIDFLKANNSKTLRRFHLVGYDFKTPVVEVNQNGWKDILKTNPKFKAFSEEVNTEKVVVIKPDNISARQDSESEAIGGSYYGNEYKDKKTLTYKFPNRLIAIDGYEHAKLKSVWLKNPVIIIDNNDSRLDFEKNSSVGFGVYDVMIDMAQKDFGKYIKENKQGDLLHQLTSIQDIYLTNLKALNRGFKFLSVITVLIFTMFMMLIIFTVKMNYSVNAIEIMTKKILGVGLIKRNSMIFVTTAISAVVSMLSLVAVLILGNFDFVPLGIVVGLVFILIEIGIVFASIIKVENQSIIKILKGGRV